MSETMTPRQSTMSDPNGTFTTYEVDFGTGRSVQFKILDEGDLFDLTRMTPDGVGSRWIGRAMLAASVTAIDGVPLPKATTEAALRQVQVKLGTEGINALDDGLTSVRPAGEEAARKARVGNSPEPQASAG